MKIHMTVSGHEIRYEDTDDVEAFVRRVRAAVDDPKVSASQVLALVYSKENPILDRTMPESPRVTRVVFENPVYDVLQDLIFRKDVAESRRDVDQIAARYRMPVADAAKQLGVATSSVHRAIQAKRLASWVKGGKLYVAPEDLANLADVGRRGPLPADVAPLEYRVGYVRDTGIMRIRIPGEDEPNGKRSPVEGRVDRWRRVGVLYGRAGKLRFFVLEPAPESNELHIGELYVRGRFKVAEHVEKSKDAEAAWEAFRPV